MSAELKGRVVWQGDAHFVGTTGSGHAVPIDGPPAGGGENRGPRPLELMVLGVGGCTAFDVVDILRKGRQDVTDCALHIDAERAPEPPAVLTRIHFLFRISGRGLNEAKVKRAIRLTAEKYCSASILLERAGVAISHGYELAEA